MYDNRKHIELSDAREQNIFTVLMLFEQGITDGTVPTDCPKTSDKLHRTHMPPLPFDIDFRSFDLKTWSGFQAWDIIMPWYGMMMSQTWNQDLIFSNQKGEVNVKGEYEDDDLGYSF